MIYRPLAARQISPKFSLYLDFRRARKSFAALPCNRPGCKTNSKNPCSRQSTGTECLKFVNEHNHEKTVPSKDPAKLEIRHQTSHLIIQSKGITAWMREFNLDLK
jgi:hypothetical protein